MERRCAAMLCSSGLGRVMMVHHHVVSEGLLGGNRDLLIEVVSSDFATKPVTIGIRISHGPTCMEPGSTRTFMSDTESHCVHNTEYSFSDGEVTTVSRILVPGRIPLSWGFANVLVSPDASSLGVHGAAASGDSGTGSVSGERSAAMVPSVVRLARPASRHTVLRAIQRYYRWRCKRYISLARSTVTLPVSLLLPAPLTATLNAGMEFHSTYKEELSSRRVIDETSLCHSVPALTALGSSGNHHVRSAGRSVDGYSTNNLSQSARASPTPPLPHQVLKEDGHLYYRRDG